MAYESIHVTEEAGLATLTFNRPATLNSLTFESASEMNDALDRLRDEGKARVLLMTGAGKAFCSGAQLSGGVLPEDLGAPLETHYNPLLERLMALPIPVVCAVNGPAAGAGCSLALAGDIVFAARSAYFLQAFVNIGLVPDCGATWLLPRTIGRARALAMMMLGERISAEQAEQWGMIYKCVDDAALMAEATAVATKLANGPTRSYALIRQGARASLDCSLTESLQIERVNQARAGRTHDSREGIAAFREKRPPAFRGK